MYIEMMAIQHALKRWLQTPHAPIGEISLNYGEKRNRPYTSDEIRKMRDFLKQHAWWIYVELFYRDGPDVFPDYSPLRR
jgi:hypothetical protein